MHCAAIVPHYEIANLPMMRVDELLLGSMFHQIHEEAFSFRNWPVDYV